MEEALLIFLWVPGPLLGVTIIFLFFFLSLPFFYNNGNEREQERFSVRQGPIQMAEIYKRGPFFKETAFLLAGRGLQEDIQGRFKKQKTLSRSLSVREKKDSCGKKKKQPKIPPSKSYNREAGVMSK